MLFLYDWVNIKLQFIKCTKKIFNLTHHITGTSASRGLCQNIFEPMGGHAADWAANENSRREAKDERVRVPLRNIIVINKPKNPEFKGRC